MNRIKNIEQVAISVRHNTKDPEYRVAQIRDLILANPDKVITLKDFSKAAYGYEYGGAAIVPILKRLRREGRVTRMRLPNKGKSYSYKWHNQRLPKDPSRTNGPVVVHAPKALSSTFNMIELIEQAKQFSWDSGSDSLREFVKFLSKKEG